MDGWMDRLSNIFIDDLDDFVEHSIYGFTD